MARFKYKGDKFSVLMAHKHGTEIVDPETLISGIHGLTDTLYDNLFDEIANDTVQRVITALKVLTDQLSHAMYGIPVATETDLEAMFRPWYEDEE